MFSAFREYVSVELVTIEETRHVVEQYLHAHDSSRVADDAVFVVMATGQESRGPAANRATAGLLLQQGLQRAFRPEGSSRRRRQGLVEGDFFGKQNMEFAGIPPSGKQVHVPLCVKYDVNDGKISRANIYFETDALRTQK